MKKDDLLQVQIEDIGSDGQGIGKVDGMTLFVKDARFRRWTTQSSLPLRKIK